MTAEHDEEAPRIASGALLVRADGAVMLLHHRAGPFTGRWSMPLVGVADNETAEHALERMLKQMLHVEPGPFAFLDTLQLTGHDGDRFVLNTFSCVDWTGTPALSSGMYDEAAWVPPAEAGVLELVPEVRDWLASQTATVEAGLRYGASVLLDALTATRGALIAAFDKIPAALRTTRLEADASPLDLLAYAADVEAYTVAEVKRVIGEPGRAWQDFNEAQWADFRALRPADVEADVRARLEAARAATRTWLQGGDASTVNAYADHGTRGVVQVGANLIELASLDRAASERLLRMALTATMQSSSVASRGN